MWKEAAMAYKRRYGARIYVRGPQNSLPLGRRNNKQKEYVVNKKDISMQIILAPRYYRGWQKMHHLSIKRLVNLQQQVNQVVPQISGIERSQLGKLNRSLDNGNMTNLYKLPLIKEVLAGNQIIRKATFMVLTHIKGLKQAQKQHVNPNAGDTVIHRSRCIRATSVNDNTRNLNKHDSDSAADQKMDSQVEEYDPEFPQGRSNKTISMEYRKLPFTGYFDASTQSYVIDNFDSNIMKLDTAAHSQIVVNAPMPHMQTNTTELPSKEARRVQEIENYADPPPTQLDYPKLGTLRAGP